jgi:DedD protein
MAYLFETEEDEETGRGKRTLGRKGRARRGGDDDDGAEITLGTRSLLGIFFGLVLICSIFFGLGYSVGRGSSAKAIVAATASEPTPLPADASASKPSAEQALTAAPAAPESDGGTSPSSETPEEEAPALEPAAAPAGVAANTGAAPASGSLPRAATPAATVKPAGFPSEVPGAASPMLKPAVATLPAANGIMVQVAAISVPQDADILVDALKKRGYSATIRNEPQDKLLHVQLGPFASRVEANAMRSKLLADGYNAVVK